MVVLSADEKSPFRRSASRSNRDNRHQIDTLAVAPVVIRALQSPPGQRAFRVYRYYSRPIIGRADFENPAADVSDSTCPMRGSSNR